MRRLALLLPSAALLLGCSRGCGTGSGGAQGSAPAASVALTDVVDCPDGLARCAGGEVMVSRLDRVPPSHACPWESLGTCRTRCVSEGLSVDLPRARALAQLCAPGPSGVAWVPAPADARLEECDEGEFRCRANVVWRCGGKALHAVATCAEGCAEIVEPIEVESVDAAAAILCKRP
jgi:hypothetical protein